MKKLILIKYAELSTKKDNIGMFIKQLKKNLEEKLSKYDAKISFDKGRMFVFVENSFEECLQAILHTFGIHEVEKVSILVKELHVNLIDSRGRELLRRTEGSLYYAAVDDVLNLCSDESSTLSRLNMLELHDLINDSVDLQSNTVSEITC